jgi:hypothetical protein
MTNWTTLRSDIANFTNRDVGTDDEFSAATNRFIASAEKRIYDECPFTLFNEQVDGTMTAQNPFVPRPPGMTRAGTMLVNVGALGFRQVYARTRTYIAEFWPNQNASLSNKPPRYWAPYDARTLIVAPTPRFGFAYRILFQGDLDPLSAGNPTSPLTERHYDMLLAACLVEAFRFSHEDQSAMMAERYEAQFQQTKAAAIVNDLGISISDAVPAEPRASGA